MGESKQRVTREALGVETSSGRVQVRRDHDAATTPFGQLVFFVEFLTLTGVLDRELPSDVPRPPSLNEPGHSGNLIVVGPLGTSTLRPHHHHPYRWHKPGPTRDNAGGERRHGALGTGRTGRHSGGRLDAGTSECERATIAVAALDTGCRCDGQAAVRHPKRRGGWLQPKEAGPPFSCVPHLSDGGLELILEVDVEVGNESHSKRTLPGLLRCIDRLSEAQRPELVRGDAGLGPAPVMAGLEARHVPYLFTLRLTKSEKHYIQMVFWHDDWEDAGQGWEGRAGELVLTGWATSRRVVRLRRSLTGDVLLADKSHQLELAFLESEVPAKRCEYAPWSPICRMRS